MFSFARDAWAVLASVVANRPFGLIAVVDGGDAEVARVAAEYCGRSPIRPSAA